MTKYSVLWAVLCLLALLQPMTTRGQSMNASISGTVLDATGAAISGAQLTLSSVATGTAAKTVFFNSHSPLHSQLS